MFIRVQVHSEEISRWVFFANLSKPVASDP